MEEIKMSKKGLFVVIEGSDGTGKKTQCDLLNKRLADEGFEVKLLDFPRYEERSSLPVQLYLNGDLGNLEDIDARAASLLFAFDRKQTADQIRAWLGSGSIVLSNRYVASNLGHQGGKIEDSVEREEFWSDLMYLEYGFCRLPKPDINIILYVDLDIAHKNVGKKEDRKYLKGKRRDIHEDDKSHQFNAAEAYRNLVETYPKDFILIECSPDGEILSAEKIHELIWKELETLLANKQ